jgi:benzoate-CoA ligase family protein
LRALGVRPEERVAMVMLDSVQFVATFLGAMRIGAVPVLTNPLLPGRDLAVIIADARARILMISGARASSLESLLADAPEIQHVVRTDEWDSFVQSDTDDSSTYDTWEESPGFWLCTSGTTGRPKLAMHRHIDLKVTSDTFGAKVLGITEDDRCYSVGPMFHAYGLGNSITFPFAVGASVVLVPTRPPTPAMVAQTIAEEKPTLFFCIPTFYAALVNADLPSDAFASVRLACSAAESLPAETFNKFRQLFGVTILDGIGSTEMLHVYLSNTPGLVKAGTSGVPVPGYDIQVVDDEGHECGVDMPGKLRVRGTSAATGYWCRSKTTRETFRGDWTLTGDLYVRDGEGFYQYLGRADDMLRIGGEWVSPAEVEGVLISHPEVLEAAVVGSPDDEGILRPVAFVIAVDRDQEVLPAATESGDGPGKPNAAFSDLLIQYCRENLAGYKRPRQIHIVPDLPKTATGKIQRFRLRQPTE